ncbi:uncharacterized protein LOC117292707 [Asterias rubens]|uniref:uncharacterized protein LOC117292707 n=1 Tax=Asterias rubens TaxID=7604 RepID=UPI001455C896|nr:uncharacterized protein LOC117292707 [Asterias rubens]XP_033630738.1 uncharacterized protein LOC117292707 [Asterias rubens]XP_033630739.1 uncharacterized protein LOC117292707 [Asterias rubens]XP_033630740.1 uncharacterized protein LOC117292707 [Asterias rubens]
MSGMTKSMESMRSWILGMATGALDYLKLKERGQAVVDFAKEKPIQAILIGVVAATSFLPAVVFVSFVTTFLVVGLVVLLAIEGVAILSALGVLIFALISSMVASAFIGMFLVSGLVVGRFTWRVSAPLRAKLIARIVALLYKGEPAPVESTTLIPEEKTIEDEYIIQD